MNIKIETAIDKITVFFVDVLLPVFGICGIILLFSYAVYQDKKLTNEGITSSRLVKVDGYIFKKLTIEGHEYLKFHESITHSGSCPCFRKMEVEVK